MEEDLIDDVFEDECQFNPNKHYRNTNTGLNFNEANFLDEETPSPSGNHPAFRNVDLRTTSGDFDDGWKSFKIEEDSEFDESILHKVILLGDSGVGKTSFIVRYHTNEFKTASFSATVGISLTTKIVQLDNTRVKLQIWDTAGQERFRSVTHAYYRDAHALLLLYDVTNKTSFDNIRAWLVEIHEYAQDDVVILLLGNKSDCPDRQVKREDGERLAREYNVTFMETSAATGLNVDLAFLAVARKLKNRKTDSTDDARFNVQDANEPPTKSLSCPPCNL